MASTATAGPPAICPTMPCCPICRGSRPILDCHDVLIGTMFMSPSAFVSFDCPVSGCRYEARGGRRLRGHSQLPNSLVLEPHEHRDANLTFVTPIVILAPLTWGSRASRRKAMICDELSTLPRLDFHKAQLDQQSLRGAPSTIISQVRVTLWHPQHPGLLPASMVAPLPTPTTPWE